jgi:Phenylalanyl tRNA synthetase beta chain CLM domain
MADTPPSVQDVAIAYGYNNVEKTIPATVTVGKELGLNHLVELLRQECAMAGYTEVLTWALCSRAENFGSLRRQDDGTTAVSIGNPATVEFEVCRTTLLPGEPRRLSCPRPPGGSPEASSSGGSWFCVLVRAFDLWSSNRVRPVDCAI